MSRFAQSEHEQFPDWPRGLSRKLVALYIGVSPSTFDKLVAAGTMPKAKFIFSRLVWDRQAVDQYFDALPGDRTAAGKADDWSNISA